MPFCVLKAAALGEGAGGVSESCPVSDLGLVSVLRKSAKPHS